MDFQDKYDVRNYLDKAVGMEVSDDIFTVIEKDEREYLQEKRRLADFCKYAETLEEGFGNLGTCIDKIESKLAAIEQIILDANNNKKMTKKLYKSIQDEIDGLKEDINDVDEYR